MSGGCVVVVLLRLRRCALGGVWRVCGGAIVPGVLEGVVAGLCCLYKLVGAPGESAW